MQRRAAQCAMGGFCGPLASLELHRAPRSARRETVKGRDAAVSRATRDAPRWSDASRLLSKSRAMRRDAQGAMLRGGETRCGCGPPCSFELRYARSRTAKGRGAAASCATRDAPRWSDARRLWADVQL